jgi:DNA-directed RNA polymerase sigma subunit (sigma70/sigma32)
MERTENSQAILLAVSEFVGTLKPRQAEILVGRIVNDILGEDKRSANSFGITKQRVGQIEKDLRGKLASHFTRSFGRDGVRHMLRASCDTSRTL